ncbi:MAG: TetR/AcrR family transcriptional regulator [Novosphingobium sp.]|nr:TetR/AcrR family transcriptional regulator [Novosphingobium sp.]MBO9601319.1 TetR/AcrR family transcriptional regulator [Novosphingobium sp.]
MNTDSHLSVKRPVAAGARDLPAPRQERSRATADRFVEAAIALLGAKTWAELSVAELARAAGRSVGVFYQRFASKDDFLAVLLTAYFDRSLALHEAVAIEGGAEAVYRRSLRAGFDRLMAHRNLWHAALERSAADPGFWQSYAPVRLAIGGIIAGKIEAALGRALAPQEARNLALAGQVFNSVINNQIINAPGPLKLEDADFYPELETIALGIAKLP